MKFIWIVPLIVIGACRPASEVSTTSDDTTTGMENVYTPSESPENAKVYIIEPEDGAIVPSGTVTVRFGLSKMGVAPAGIDFPHAGHHHLLVNAAELPPMDQPIPADSAHLHFGTGQTETDLDLAPGIYTLQLLLGDFAHIPHEPPVLSEPVTITVQ